MKPYKFIKLLEKNIPVVKIFQYQDTSAWVYVKVAIGEYLYDKNIQLKLEKKNIFTIKGLCIVWITLKSYFSYFVRRKCKKSIFFGSSRGLFDCKGNVLDEYFPYYDIEPSKVIYCLHGLQSEHLYKYKDYLSDFNVMTLNYLFGFLKKIIGLTLKISSSSNKKNDSLLLFFDEYNIPYPEKKIKSAYFEFIAGYYLYRVFLKSLAIEQAYIVSPTTKSDICAALKSLGIKIIEIQHGVLGRTHRGYNYNLPKDFRLPVPDQINVYNDFWKGELLDGGYFVEQQIKVTGRLKYDLVEEVNFDMDNKYIIFTGQGAYTKQVMKFFKESMQFLKENNVKLIYKAHPRELDIDVQHIREELKEIDCLELYQGGYNTEVLIKHSLAHISIFSSCHFDAIYYKNITYILDVMMDNVMNYYVDTSPKNFVRLNKIEELKVYLNDR